MHVCAKAQPGKGGAEGAQAPPLAIRILMFIFLVFHQHCTVSRDRVHCKMFFGSTTGVATHSLSNQEVLPCSASVETSMTFELPTVSTDV